MASNINVSVSAAGLQQSIVTQAQQAQQQLNRRPLALKLDPKGFRQPLGRITGDMNEFQKSLDASVARTFAFGAAVGVVNNVTQAFKALVTTTIEVQKELVNINVLLGATTAGLAKFSNDLFGVAKNTAQTFRTVAEAATEFSRQGLSAEETLKRVQDAMILTRLSGLSATQSVESLTAAINGFRKEAITSTEVINRLANVDAAFAVSSKDLADALARAGSTAQGAKVEFNELLAAVTSVQQQTARGGAVIGNAFKSIFTRIQRSGVQDALNEIGVATQNVDGSFRSGIAVIKDYAAVYNVLTDAQKAYTSEQIAGVFQINNLKALVNDLNSEYSIYNRALATANNSTDQAARRNEELNTTLAALLAQTATSAQQMAAAIGELAAAPAIERILKGLGAVAEFFVNVLDPEKGSKLARGFFAGIGSFIAGPGLIIVGGAFLKLFTFISKQASSALREIFNINTETARQQQLQQAILGLVTSEESVYRQIVANAGNQAAQEAIILNALKQQTAERAKQQAFLAQMASSAALQGLSVQGGAIAPIPGRRGAGARRAGLAGGHVPVFANSDEFVVKNFGATQEAKAIKAGVGGASSGARVVQTSINPKKDAILNPDMVAAMGLPRGAQRLGAAGGFVPNFAKSTIPLLGGPNLSVITPTMKGTGHRRGFTKLKDATRQIGDDTVSFTFADPLVDKLGPMGVDFTDDEDLLATAMLKHSSMLDEYVKSATLTFFQRSGASKLFKPSYANNVNEIKAGNVAQKMIAEKSGARGELFEEIILGMQNDISREGGAGGGQDPIDLNPSRKAGRNVVKFFNRGNTEGGPRKYEIKAGAVEPMTTKYINDVIFNATNPTGSVDEVGSKALQKLLGPEGAARAKKTTGAAAVKKANRPPPGTVVQVDGQQWRVPQPKRRWAARDVDGNWNEGMGKPNPGTLKSLGFKAGGFIPNFATGGLGRAVNTENAAGGDAVVDFHPAVGMFVRDGKTQSSFSQAVAQHGGKQQALQDSMAMQGLSTGFVPNFVAAAVAGVARAGAARATGASAKAAGKTGGMFGNMQGNMMLSFLAPQILGGLKGGLEGIKGEELSPATERVMGGAIQGVSIGALAGPWGAVIGGVVGAVVPALMHAFDPVKITSGELAKKLEELDAAQKRAIEGFDQFIQGTINLQDAIKSGDAGKVQKAMDSVVDSIISADTHVAAKMIENIGGDMESLQRAAAKLAKSNPAKDLLEIQESFVKGHETKGDKKAENLKRGVTQLISTLDEAGTLDTSMMGRVLSENTFQAPAKRMLKELKKTGALTAEEYNKLIESIDPKDMLQIRRIFQAEIKRMNLKKQLEDMLKPIGLASFNLEKEFEKIAAIIAKRVTIITSEFKAAADAIEKLEMGVIGAMQGAGDITGQEALRRKEGVSEEKIRADANLQRDLIRAQGTAVRGSSDRKKLQKALEKVNETEQKQLDQLKASTQAQVSLLTIQQAIKANTQLSSKVLSEQKILGKVGGVGGVAGGRVEAQNSAQLLGALNSLTTILAGLDITALTDQLKETVAIFNVAQIAQGLGFDANAGLGMEGLITQLEQQLPGADPVQGQLLADLIKALKEQRDIARDPEAALDKEIKKIGDLFDVNLGEAAFRDLAAGLSQEDQIMTRGLQELNKSFKAIEALPTTMATLRDDFNQTTRNIQQVYAEQAAAQRTYNENLQKVQVELKKIAEAERALQASGGNAGGFIPQFSPLSRAVKTESALGGKPVVDYHPGVGTYVRDGRTQKTFRDVVRAHPEGMRAAINNSRAVQGAAGGFVPNFATDDPGYISGQPQPWSGGGPNVDPAAEMRKVAGQRGNRESLKRLLNQLVFGSLRDPLYAMLNGSIPGSKVGSATVSDAYGVNFMNNPRLGSLKKRYASGSLTERNAVFDLLTSGELAGQKLHEYANLDEGASARLIKRMTQLGNGSKRDKEAIKNASNQDILELLKEGQRGGSYKAFKSSSLKSALQFVIESNLALEKYVKAASEARSRPSPRRGFQRVMNGVDENLVSKDLVDQLVFNLQAEKGGTGRGLSEAQAARAGGAAQDLQGGALAYELLDAPAKAKFLLNLIPQGGGAAGPQLAGLQKQLGFKIEDMGDYSFMKSVQSGTLGSIWTKAGAKGQREFLLPRIAELQAKGFKLPLPTGRGGKSRPHAFTNLQGVSTALGIDVFTLDALLQGVKGKRGVGGQVGQVGAAAGPAGFANPLGLGREKFNSAAAMFLEDEVFKIHGLASGFIPNFSTLGEIAASRRAGYKSPVTAGQVRSTSIPGLGRVNYNSQERVLRAPGMRQPFIVPPSNSAVAPDYAKKVQGKFGFNPYKSGLAGGFVPNFQGLPSMDFSKFTEAIGQFTDDVDKFASAMDKTLDGKLNVTVDTAGTLDTAGIQAAVQAGVVSAVNEYFTNGAGVSAVLSLAQAVFDQNIT